jgi:hypothetical protein
MKAMKNRQEFALQMFGSSRSTLLQGVCDWLDMAQNRDKWPTLVNMATNFTFHKMQGDFL